MFRKLVNHNEDIKKLIEKGYAVSTDSNCLIIRDIPYLGGNRELQIGTIVSKYLDVDGARICQDDHQIYFAGAHPCEINGMPIQNLGGGTCSINLSAASNDVKVQRSFSNKPQKTGKFEDFFHKIESYVAIISGPAMELHGITPYTFNNYNSEQTESVFTYNDTLSFRAEISDVSLRLKADKVAIIGLGGTGAYVLDFMVRTPVGEIRAFDSDKFYVHNAFRSPGRLIKNEFNKSKAELYEDRYSNFRNNLFFEDKFINDESESDLSGVTFAFVCVDNGVSRAGIFDILIKLNIPFVDVGIGLNKKDSSLNGMARTTLFPIDEQEKIRSMQLAEENRTEDNIYKVNVQIAEINALNACLAVIKYKQLRGFYFNNPDQFHLIYNLANNKITEMNKNEISTSAG